MAPPIYIGVELESHVGFLTDRSLPLPGSAVGRIVYFPVDKELAAQQGLALAPDPSTTPMFAAVHWSYLVRSSVYHDVAATLRAAGLQVVVHPVGIARPHSTNSWAIGEESMELPEIAPYFWAPCEITSQPMPFDADSMAKISMVCNLLQSKYVVHCGKKCGLHVHVSANINPAKMIDFATTKKLSTFLWAFEPLLDTLHPEARQANKNCKSWYRNTALARKLKQDQSQTTFVTKGISAIKKTATFEELFTIVIDNSSKYAKYLAVNVRPAEAFERHQRKSKQLDDSLIPTIEFRQHSGTLSAAEVVAWIEVVVGIVGYCHRVGAPELDKLVLKALEKRGMKDGNVTGEGKQKGSASKEDDFTVIDLLRSLSLDHVAAYYQGRTFPLLSYSLRPSTGNVDV